MNDFTENTACFDVSPLSCMVDLHLHLDGAIFPASARKLAKLQGIAIPESDAELLKLMQVDEDCRDLNEFLEKFAFPCSLIQTKEGIREAMADLLKELKTQGVMYAEVRFAPQKSTEKGLTQEEVVEAALSGIENSGMDAGLILCCMRGDDNREENLETVRVAEKYLEKGVVAVDLAGAEALFATGNFADVFSLAKKKKIPVILHAGEADGPESVRAALRFGASRIGHGVRSLEDEALVKELAEKKIPLEGCPTSNVQTQTVPSLAAWPLREMCAAGLVITINTDDPSISGTSIKEEYRKLIRQFGLKKEDVRALLKNAVTASFAKEATKKKLFQKIDREFDRKTGAKR